MNWNIPLSELRRSTTIALQDMLRSVYATDFSRDSNQKTLARCLGDIIKTGLVSYGDIDTLMMWEAGTTNSLVAGQTIVVGLKDTSPRPLLTAILAYIAERHELSLIEIFMDVARAEMEAKAAEAERQAEEASLREERERTHGHMVDILAEEMPNLEHSLAKDLLFKSYISRTAARANIVAMCPKLGHLAAISAAELRSISEVGYTSVRNVSNFLKEEYNLKQLEDPENVPPALASYRQEVLAAFSKSH